MTLVLALLLFQAQGEMVSYNAWRIEQLQTNVAGLTDTLEVLRNERAREQENRLTIIETEQDTQDRDIERLRWYFRLTGGAVITGFVGWLYKKIN